MHKIVTQIGAAMAATTVFLKDYTPPAFRVEQIHLTIDLYEEYALVKNNMELTRLQSGPLCLNGDEVELVSIALEGIPLHPEEYRIHENNLLIDNDFTKFNLSIITRIYPQKNTALSGLFRSNGFFCTQCEAEGFRRITYFLDRPDVLTIYTTRISADKQKYPNHYMSYHY